MVQQPAEQPAEQPAQRASAPAVALIGVLAATCLMLVLAVWAASIGPDEVVTGGENAGVTLSRNTDANTASGPRTVPDPQPLKSEDPEGHGIARFIARTLIVLALLVAAYGVRRALARALRRPRKRRGRKNGSGPDPDFETLEAPQRALAEEILRDALAQRQLLETGEPRNAIVDCWHRFELQAASQGLGRQPWETSSEFILRLLASVQADSQAVADLAALYREARYSDHDLDEGARRRALINLGLIHAALDDHWVSGGVR